LNVTNKKQTMYEILNVSPTASLPEIKAAHKRRSLELMSGALGLSREDVNFQLSLLDVALHTLSVPVLRDAYDAELAETAPLGHPLLPVKAGALSLVDAARANQIVAAIEDSQRHAALVMQTSQFPVQEVSSTVSMSVRSLKTILRVVIGLLVLGFFIRMGQVSVAHRHAGQQRTSDELKAEDKLIILEYYKKHGGVRPSSRAEAMLLEKEYRRVEDEQLAKKNEERRKDEQYRWFVEESRREGEYIHEDLVRSDQEARDREEQRRRAEAETKRYEEEAAQRAERIRIANERRKLGLDPNPPGADARADAGESEER
jgi:hypothetical protein